MSDATQEPQPEFEEILRRHPREVYRLVRRFVDDAEEALDLTQEVLLRAFLHRGEFRSESAFTTWLYRIALNLSRDEHRKRARRQARELLTPEALETSSGEPSALDALIVREHSERLEQVIQALPADQYIALVLHYYGGLSQQQVAEVVDASVSAVESRLRRARARLERLLQRDESLDPVPDGDGHRFLTVGRVLLQLRDREAALRYCERAAALMPDDVDALCTLGTVYWQLKNLDGAWEMAQRSLRADPHSGEAHNLCGIVHGLRREHDAAVTAFARAAADEGWPGRARAYGNMGTTFAWMRRWGDAMAALEQAIALNPDYAMAYSHLGNIHLEQRRYDEALRCQDRATELDPPYFQGHFNRGSVLEAMGRTDEAIGSYRRASQLAPWWIDAHAALGLLLHAQGQHDEAEAQFTTALSIDGGGGMGLYFKARIRLVRGDREGALGLFEHAAREGPEWAEPLLWVALLQEQRRDLAAAARAVREAAEREPENFEVRARLAALGGR